MDFSDKAFTLTVELCAQVLRQQTRASEYVREGVEKNKVGNNNRCCDFFYLNNICALGDRRPGEPDHGAEQRDGRVEGGEQRQPQRHQQAQGQSSGDKHSTGKLTSDNLVCTSPNENQVCLDSDETGGCRSPSPPCLSSTASLPSLPSSHPNNNNNLITYSRCPSLSYSHLLRQFVL